MFFWVHARRPRPPATAIVFRSRRALPPRILYEFLFGYDDARCYFIGDFGISHG